MSLMLEDKISSSMYTNSKGEIVVRTIPSIALPSEWNDITIENNVLGNPTVVKYFLNSIFLLKVNILIPFLHPFCFPPLIFIFLK